MLWTRSGSASRQQLAVDGAGVLDAAIWLEHAVAESFFATLKNELIYRHVCHRRARDGTHNAAAEAGADPSHIIAGWSNQHRRHSTLGYRSRCS